VLHYAFSPLSGFFVRPIKSVDRILLGAYKVFLLCYLAWPMVFHCTRKCFRFSDLARARSTFLHALRVKIHHAAAIVHGGKKGERGRRKKKATRNLITVFLYINRFPFSLLHPTQKPRAIADLFVILYIVPRESLKLRFEHVQRTRAKRRIIAVLSFLQHEE